MRPTPDWPTRDLLAHRVEATPDATATIDAATGRARSFATVSAAVDRFVPDLRPHLDGSGDRPRVGIAASTSAAFVTALFGAWRSGAAAVPVATERPTDELRERLDRLDLDCLVEPHADDFADLDIDLPRLSVDGDAGTAGSAPPSAQWAPDETALILFTSGTTGRPKGVRLTHRNLVASATASAFRLGVTPADRWHCCLPTNHMGGLAPIVRSVLYGTAVVLQSAFDPATTAASMAEHRATGVSLVPTMLRRLLDEDWEPHEALRFVLLGGAPARPALVEDGERAGVPMCPTYGTTETASQIATATPGTASERPGSVGQPLVTATVTLVDPDGGEPVEPGSVGEVVVDGPIVTPGYLDAAATDAAFGEYGLHTGDLARRHDSGALSILGRLDDAIQTGGETVHPARVTDALRALPAVTDAAVVGLPDPEWGERVGALVVSSASMDPDGLRTALRDSLAPYEVPKTIERCEALPRTDSGTIDRDAVRAVLRAGDPSA